MTPVRRSLCIVSRDPLQCSELVLSLQASLEPDDEIEIIMDRRRARDLFETESRGPDPLPVDRRRNTDVDLEVRTKGFALVPGAASPRATGEPDAEDRARFENILSFRRRHERRPGRAVAAASAVMVALILMPSLDLFPDRIPGDAPFTEVPKPEPAGPAPRIGHVEPSGSARTPAVGGQASSVPAPASPSRRPSNPETQAARARTSRAPRPSKAHDAIEAYAARVENATGRVVSKARGLIDRVRSEVIGNAPMHVGFEPSGEGAPPTVTRRRPDSP
jgi:hypothetical protein